MRSGAIVFLLVTGSLYGQSYQQQATISGNGSVDEGLCNIEVQVDTSAEVQIRGTNAVLTNIAGQAPQWRRFDCTGPMPVNPLNFKYYALSGRGQQQLVRDPSSSGVAIVRIDDKSGGSALYAFRIEWRGYTGNAGPFGAPQQSTDSNQSIFTPGPGDDNEPAGRGKNKGKGKGRENAISNAEAVETCQQEIMNQAMRRFNTNNIFFRRTAIDNNKGGQDQIRGTIDVNNNSQSQRYRFTCAVNLNNGRLRSAQIDNVAANQNSRDYGYNGGNYDAMGVTNANRAIQGCESAVERRLAEEGLQRVGFGSVDLDQQVGSDRVFGSATAADRNQRQQVVDFSCRVNVQNGTVNSVDVVRRR